jgi:hypothetical protein
MEDEEEDEEEKEKLAATVSAKSEEGRVPSSSAGSESQRHDQD